MKKIFSVLLTTCFIFNCFCVFSSTNIDKMRSTKKVTASSKIIIKNSKAVNQKITKSKPNVKAKINTVDSNKILYTQINSNLNSFYGIAGGDINNFFISTENGIFQIYHDKNARQVSNKNGSSLNYINNFLFYIYKNSIYKINLTNLSETELIKFGNAYINNINIVNNSLWFNDYKNIYNYSFDGKLIKRYYINTGFIQCIGFYKDMIFYTSSSSDGCIQGQAGCTLNSMDLQGNLIKYNVNIQAPFYLKDNMFLIADKDNIYNLNLKTFAISSIFTNKVISPRNSITVFNYDSGNIYTISFQTALYDSNLTYQIYKTNLLNGQSSLIDSGTGSRPIQLCAIPGDIVYKTYGEINNVFLMDSNGFSKQQAQ